MKAWIVKWSWVGDHAAVDKPIIIVLSARTSAEDVRKFVERYYASTMYSVSEQLRMARYNKPDAPSYPAEFALIEGVPFQGIIMCGHNPFIEAFLAEGVETADSPSEVVWDRSSVRLAREKAQAAIQRLNSS